MIKVFKLLCWLFFALSVNTALAEQDLYSLLIHNNDVAKAKHPMPVQTDSSFASCAPISDIGGLISISNRLGLDMLPNYPATAEGSEAALEDLEKCLEERGVFTPPSRDSSHSSDSKPILGPGTIISAVQYEKALAECNEEITGIQWYSACHYPIKKLKSYTHANGQTYYMYVTDRFQPLTQEILDDLKAYNELEQCFVMPSIFVYDMQNPDRNLGHTVRMDDIVQNDDGSGDITIADPSAPTGSLTFGFNKDDSYLKPEPPKDKKDWDIFTKYSGLVSEFKGYCVKCANVSDLTALLQEGQTYAIQD